MNKVQTTNNKAFPKIRNILINDNAIEKLTETFLNEELDTLESNLFEDRWSLPEIFNLTLIFNAMNFCYWAQQGEPKWTIEINGKSLDGSIALAKLVEKAATEDRRFLDWGYLHKLSWKKFRKMFEGSNTAIPLIKERYDNLFSLASDMLSQYQGSSDNLLKATSFCASRMLKRLSTLKCFEDESVFENEIVYFWKRAQLQVKMFNDIRESFGYKPMQNLHVLTAFADYKVPQLLRHLGILRYSKELSEKVDNYKLIPKDSRLENEIRISTVVAVEKISSAANAKGIRILPSHVDSILWNRAASNMHLMKPYHRTYTTSY